MKIHNTEIEGLYVAELTPVGDHRGTLMRLFCQDELSYVIGRRKIVQVNRTVTYAAGAIRGMHFQKPPHAELKCIQCLRGRVLDVAVDIRAGSKTFLKHVAVELSPENHKMFILPEGFSQVFPVLEPDSEMLYFHTEFYTPDAEGGLKYDDPALGINWPLDPVDVSQRDSSHPPIKDDFEGITL